MQSTKTLCTRLVTDIPGTVCELRQELILYLTYIVNDITKNQELADLTAVEVPASIFDTRLDRPANIISYNYLIILFITGLA